MGQVKLILKEEVIGLGAAGEAVSVKPGYARNFLLPQGKAVVATRDLLRGELVTAADVRLEQQDLTRLHSGYLSARDLAVGKRVKRTVRQGRIIKPTQIVAPTLIKKGAEVTITVNSNRIQVRTKGEALSSGGPGERIRVRNLSSNKLLEATVVSAGIVQVDL